VKSLSPPAKVYIVLTILLGSFSLGWNLFHLDREDLWTTMVLSVLASLSLILKVEGSTKRSHYNISFVIYAFTFVLLGPEEAIIVVLIANLVEWAWYRYPWYIPSFNISSHILVMHLTGIIYQWINPGSKILGWLGVVSILVGMAVFTLLNHLMIGLVIWLARGENFTKSGMFEFLPLMLDYTLLCLGGMATMIWLFNPYAVVLFLLPLYPIYSTLKVPALERKTETDPKTGLYNANYFEQALASELKRADRFDRPLTVVMADLDLLRNINNTYGHLAGDEVLKGIANILKGSVREYDVVARFGGEEFAILIPETTPQQAYPRVESIRSSIEKADFMVPTSVTPIRATMSFGISGREGSMNSPQEIIHKADTALYHAKLKGRNGTFICSDEGIYNLFIPLDEEIQAKSEVQIEIPASKREAAIPAPSSKPFITEGPHPEEVATRPSEKARGQTKWLVNAYIAFTVLCGLSLFALFYNPDWKPDWIGLAIFAFGVVLTEWLSIDIYDARGTAVSTSTVPMLAGTLLFGPVAALVLSVTLAAVALFKYRSPISRFFFNSSNQLIAAMLYLALIESTGEIFIHQPIWYQFLFSMAAVGIVYLVTTGLISLGVSLDLRASVREIWAEKFSWLVTYYFAMGLIAYALIFSYQTAGLLGTIITLIPLMLLRFSQMQYIDRTKLVVQEIREKNTALQRSANEIQRLSDGLLETLAEVVDLRDPYVLGHSKQVARYAVLMAKKLGLHPKQVELVRKAGLLHDIGKLGVSESILLKPDHLTPAEHNIVKQHSLLGAELLENSRSLNELTPIIRHHHEYYDGRGYPDRLKGTEIPIEARILAVADAVEAMASDRPYRHGMTAQEILEELNKNAGTQFDPRVVKAFVQIARSEKEPLIVNSARKVFVEEKIISVD
jgi:diguanylate cyclase (GGDEF)-like protein/putative nucleotidyltransferase with HDIG domain